MLILALAAIGAYTVANAVLKMKDAPSKELNSCSDRDSECS